MTPKKTATKPAADHYNNDADRLPGTRWVSMTNALTRAGHGLSLSEKRLICCAVSTLDSRKPVDHNKPPVTRIYAADYAETFGIDMTTAYEQLQDGAKNIYNRSITFYLPAHKRAAKGVPMTKATMRWVGKVHYQDGEGWVELHWWHEVIPHLTGLRKNFTSYQLGQATALRSVYSWRLLELLTRFEDTGWLEVTVEDFATAMDATEKQRADFAKLRTKIIEPAIQELTHKDGWLIELTTIKAGRKVTALRFTFQRNPQGQLGL